MKCITTLIVAGLVFGFSTSYGVIEGSGRISIDFTNSAEAKAKATWSELAGIAVTADGLGWDGQFASSRDGWFQTKPLALGLSWRPTSAFIVQVEIHPLTRIRPDSITAPDFGDLYVRYSADLKHWSTWQVLQRGVDPQSTEEKGNRGWYFNGTIRVSNRERIEYARLVGEYERLDVPWKSDEEAAVRWIVKRDPEFFSKYIPFIGYVEFLFENQFRGGQRIQSFNATLSYVSGGISVPPKDGSKIQDRFVPWRFRDESVPDPELNSAANRGEADRL